MASSCKVLIIDDDDDVRESLVSLLHTEGFETRAAKSGPEALSILTQDPEPPDAILLDLLMPSMSGDQFRELLQRHPQWSKIPVILSSAGPVPEHVGPDVFAVLHKPFDLDHLLELVKKACRG